MQDGRTLTHIQQDVDFANRYRIAYIKHLMSLSAGIFVISIAFMRDVIGAYSQPVFKSGLVSGWACLILSLVAGILHMKCWDRFYISYRKPKEEGEKRRNKINTLRVGAEAGQIAFFVLGLVLIFYFAAANLPG